MKSVAFAIIFVCIFSNLYSQKVPTNFDFDSFKSKLNQTSLASADVEVSFTDIKGELLRFNLKEYSVSVQKIDGIKTYEGETDGHEKSNAKITVFDDHIEGIFKTISGYYFIFPEGKGYSIISAADPSINNFSCGVKDLISNANLGQRVESIAPFPIGSVLRKFRLAAAATGEMSTRLGSQANALASIVSVINAANLIYENDLAIRFELISKTTNNTLIFTNGSTDPFTIATVVSGSVTYEVASTTNAQNGFNAMNTSGLLTYSEYDVGHVFHVEPSTGIAASGLAGPIPCNNSAKSKGWTQWSVGATFPTNIGMVVRVFSHEVGHQFNADHTYNALGGNFSGSTFCTTGWSSSDAVEPGAGSTLMGYHDNCKFPDYTLTGDNKQLYFHTKSLDKINNYLISTATCFTPVALTNSPPVANAGADITIPKGTPFKLHGTATDANNDALSYTWDQVNAAGTLTSKGSFGSSINGVDGISAVNSISAPLFRSEQSNIGTRYFPRLLYVANNANNPADAAGEDLPQIARTLNFRLTVRDGKTGGGGVDSDDLNVIVSNNGPLEVTSPATAITWAVNTSNTITWNVAGTMAEAANVSISLSIDGGLSFPYMLLSSTPNDGSQSISLPAIIAATTKARVKVSGILTSNLNAEFFDVSPINFSITSSCSAFAPILCPTANVTALQGNAAFNFGYTADFKPSDPVVSKAVAASTFLSGATIVGYSNASLNTCQVLTSPFSQYNTSFKFRVSKTGSYTISRTTGYLIMGVHTQNTGLSCTNFIGGNSYADPNGGLPLAFTSFTINLNECTDYYLFTSAFSTSGTWTISFTGVGSVIEPLALPSGTTTLNVAVSTTDSKIKLGSYLNDFTSLQPGTYRVYALSFPSSGASISTYYGQTLAQLMAAVCAIPSSAFKTLNVLCNGNPNAPTTTSDVECGSGPSSFTLTAAGCSFPLEYRWYDTPTGSNVVSSTSYYFPTLSAPSKTFYVSCINGICESTRTAVNATFNPKPNTPTVNNPNITSPQTVMLSATGCSGSIKWYDQLNNLASSNASFVTGLISSTTLYYAICTANSCQSNAATATITFSNPCPQNVVHNTGIIAAATYKASNLIESSVQVQSGVIYQSGKSIILKPGFKTASPVFKAYISGCN